MATIIDFPDKNRNSRKSKKTDKTRTNRRADRVAYALVFFGLGMSALTLCVGSVYHESKRLYRKVKNKVK
jgi:hypothetical protein